MWDNSSFTITLDHHISERTRNFSLKNVKPGSHYVKIVKKKKNHHGHGGFVQTIYKGYINVPSKRKVFVKVEGRNRLSFKFFKKKNNHHHGNHYGARVIIMKNGIMVVNQITMIIMARMIIIMDQ